jgi:hypothetical protein
MLSREPRGAAVFQDSGTRTANDDRRMRLPSRQRESGQPDATTGWPSATELLNVLHVLALLVEMEPAQATTGGDLWRTDLDYRR